MTDARLHPTFLTNHKVDELDDSTFRVYVNGIVLAASQETDGSISRRSLRLLHPEADVRACAVNLVAAGLWESDGDGWRVHDFLNYQTSKAQSEALREAARLRKAKSRAGKSQRDKSGSHGVTGHGVTTSDKGQVRTETGQAEKGEQKETSLWPELITCRFCSAPVTDVDLAAGITSHKTCQKQTTEGNAA